MAVDRKISGVSNPDLTVEEDVQIGIKENPFGEEIDAAIEIEETDLLFLDTTHVYSQLKKELELHSDKARKYICFHDTTSYETKGEDGKEGTGIWKAIEEFLEDNKDKWILQERFTNNNGFTIIKRINNG